MLRQNNQQVSQQTRVPGSPNLVPSSPDSGAGNDMDEKKGRTGMTNYSKEDEDVLRMLVAQRNPQTSKDWDDIATLFADDTRTTAAREGKSLRQKWKKMMMQSRNDGNISPMSRQRRNKDMEESSDLDDDDDDDVLMPDNKRHLTIGDWHQEVLDPNFDDFALEVARLSNVVTQVDHKLLFTQVAAMAKKHRKEIEEMRKVFAHHATMHNHFVVGVAQKLGVENLPNLPDPSIP